jgi:RimJ/RimL family protein N-acetyltransferase
MQRPEAIVLTRGAVRLEPIARHHVNGLAAALAEDPASFTIYGPNTGGSTIETWAAQAFADADSGVRMPFTVFSNDVVAGTSSYLDIAPADGRIEIGHTWYGAPWRGTNVNPSAKLLLMQHAFETLGATRVALKTDARNERSRRAIAGAGATFEGILRKHSRRADGPGLRDVAMFSVTDDEWPRARELLEKRLA